MNSATRGERGLTEGANRTDEIKPEHAAWQVEDRAYTLPDIAMMTGITERTLRKRLAEGALRGVKQGGKWRFTQEEVGAFFDRPEIRRLAAAHRRALADDFLDARIKRAPACLCVVDMPDVGKEFIERVLSACEGVRMAYSYDDKTGMTRVTLSGDPAGVSGALRRLISDEP